MLKKHLCKFLFLGIFLLQGTTNAFSMDNWDDFDKKMGIFDKKMSCGFSKKINATLDKKGKPKSYSIGGSSLLGKDQPFLEDHDLSKSLLYAEVSCSFQDSHGKKGNSKETGHHLDHWLGADPEHQWKGLDKTGKFSENKGGGIGKKLDNKNKTGESHTVFHGSNPKDLLDHGIQTDPSVHQKLHNLSPGERTELSVNLKGYKGNKDFVEFHGSHHAALPNKETQKADEILYVIDKKKDGAFHIQTAYPRKVELMTHAEGVKDLFSHYESSSVKLSPSSSKTLPSTKGKK
jgi:hypothetical protein